MKEAAPLYDRDFFEWTARNAQLLREGRFGEVDAGHLAASSSRQAWQDTRESLDPVFSKAVDDAVYETRLPFAFEQVTDQAFLPD